jgi:hypothetical protein
VDRDENYYPLIHYSEFWHLKVHLTRVESLEYLLVTDFTCRCLASYVVQGRSNAV